MDGVAASAAAPFVVSGDGRRGERFGGRPLNLSVGVRRFVLPLNGSVRIGHDRTVEVSARSYEPIGEADLHRIATFVGLGHERRTASRPELAGRLVAGCLAQGAAAHLLDGVTGVKDIDVWLFYDTRGIRFVHGLARNRLDFGPSRFGRHPDDPPRFTGRRVDVMARSVPRGMRARA